MLGERTNGRAASMRIQAVALVFALGMSLLGAVSVHAEELSSWGHFSEAFRSGFVRVDVFESSGPNSHWVFKRTDAEASADIKRTDWADSRRCPALTQSMNRLEDVEWPAIATPGNLERLRRHGPSAGQVTVVSDPNVYELDYRALYKMSGLAPASISVLAYDDSPLATWMHDTLKNVDACWDTKEIK